MKKEGEDMARREEIYMEAISPALVKAIEGLGEHTLAASLANNLPKADGQLGALLGISGYENLVDVLRRVREHNANNDKEELLEE